MRSICAGAIVLVLLFQLPVTGAATTRVQHRMIVDPCSNVGTGAERAVTRVRIDRNLAVYVVAHLRKACESIAKSTADGAPLAAARDQLQSIAASIRLNLLEPIYRAHPMLESANVQAVPAPHGTRRKISRRTAVWLDDNLNRLTEAISDSAKPIISDSASRERAMATDEAMLDITSELSFADKIAYDAYSDLWRKMSELAFSKTPARTDESDASFRKQAPPIGSVKLSDKALKTIKDFMSAARRADPNHDQVAGVGWTLGSESKGPNDKEWKKYGPGLDLGAWARKQLPPDVIDHVGGIDIVFDAPDPSMLAGKTIDIQNGKFFLRD